MKNTLTTLCFLALSHAAAADDKADQAPTLKAIMVGSETSAIDENQSGIVLQDITLPGKAEALTARLQPFLGQEITPETPTQVKQEISAYYTEANQPFLLVQIPEQDVTTGKVRYVIMEGHVGDILYTGNKWFSSELLGRYLHVKSGDKIDEPQLLNDVASMNRNPFHFTEVVLQPGDKKGKTDIELMTQEHFPLRVFGGADNTGNPFTGNSRYFAGFNWGNALFQDDLLTYQFTTADNYKRFWSHFGSYTSFFSWGHSLFLYGGYSEIHPHIRNFSSEGKSYQGSLRYNMPLKPYYKSVRQEVGVGADIKGMNSSLFFSDLTGSIPVSAHLSNLSQLVLSYGLQQSSPRNKLNLSLEFFASPVLWMANQNKERFNEIRPHALPRYFYSRLNTADNWTLPHKFVLAANLRLQGATMPLMPSEQFGLGGYNSVRGYDEHAFNADLALCANVELRMPTIKVFKCSNALTFLAFLDYGVGHNFKNDFHGVSSTEHLLGIGPGVRYEIYPYLSLRADYGFKFHKFENSGPSSGKFHFSATASY